MKPVQFIRKYPSDGNNIYLALPGDEFDRPHVHKSLGVKLIGKFCGKAHVS